MTEPAAPDSPAVLPYASTGLANASPLRELLLLAIPTVLQMLSYTVEQFTDIYMLSKVSDAHATAAGQAGLLAFCVLSFGFGILMLINALVSQSFGGGRNRDCGPYMWQGIWIGIGFGVAVLPTMVVSPWVFTQMKHGDLVPLEVRYFDVAILFVVVKMVALALGQFTLAINRPNIVLVAAFVGMIGNIFVNWLLIYGNWGFPALDVTGAAWGTNAAITIELLIVAGFVLSPVVRRTYNTCAMRVDRAKLMEVLRLGIPSGLQMIGDVAAWTIFFGFIIAFYGEKALAANNYMIQFMKLSFMPAFGLGVAVTALVGRYIGAGRPEVAEQRAHLGFKVAMVYMLSCAALFLLGRNLLMKMFSDDPEIVHMGMIVLIFCSAFQLFDALFIIYSSALRGAGDTFWPMVVQISLVWTILVGGGLSIAKLFPGWGIAGPWTVGVVYVIILGIYLMQRFRAGGWKKPPTAKESPESMTPPERSPVAV